MTQLPNTLIAEHSHRQLHSFLDELKNGTQNYRTVSSLGEQVAQEYRGRCVIELMQNAHDALREAPEGDARLITLVLQTSPTPVLLAGNSGTPFREEDFRGISQLGQSPKDPNKSVGNKGLGFRSVLEVSSCPEVWSVAPNDRVPPFQFAFRPNVLDRVAEALESLGRLGTSARCPFVPSSTLVDWSLETLQVFQDRFGRAEQDLRSEIKKYLSPYQFPVEAGETPPEVKALLDSGHKTVIRLPIDGGRSGRPDDAVRSIREQFKEIDSDAMVFLSHVRTLSLKNDETPRTFVRESSSGATNFDAFTDYQRIDVHETTGTPKLPPRVFHLWRRVIGGSAEDHAGQEEIREAVRHLPNRWPEVRSATVGIATEETDEPREGKFVIFLPTTVGTGTGASINAPFFGSLDRRFIKFDDPYNGLLWRYIVALGLRIVRELAASLENTRRAQVIVDIAGSTAPVPGLGKRVLSELLATSSESGQPLEDEPILLCRSGWSEARKARSIFAVPESSGVAQAVWKQHAAFAILDDALQSRLVRVTALAEACGGTLKPTDSEIAATVGALAAAVQDRSVLVTWHAFLESVVDILPEQIRTLKPQQTDPLRAVKFLPAQSGQLLSTLDQSVLFFQPKRGTDEGRDFAGDVPASIQDRVAFLHKDIVTQEGPQGRNTPVQKFLDTRFAREFRRDEIVRRVVEPAIPKLPVALDAPEAILCADLLAWTLKLLGTDPPQSMAAVLQKLPVPCYGGWYPMRETTFGPAWGGSLGTALQTLADALPASDSNGLLSKSLLPPTSGVWSGTMPNRIDSLIVGGAVYGFRLRLAEEPVWNGKFLMEGGGGHQLPSNPAPGFSQETWDSWRQAVRGDANPRYTGLFWYRLSNVHILPELAYVGKLPTVASRALSELLLASFKNWPNDWSRVTLQKTEGQSWSTPLKSPLRHALRTLAWFVDGETIRPLAKRWYVREVLLGFQRDRFSHLRPLTGPMARRLGADPELCGHLTALGLNTFPIDEEKIGAQLLDALAVAWDKKRIAISRLDVFLGQVRDAWRHFNPLQPLPQRFVISAGRRIFKTCSAGELGSVYLPDNVERVRTLIEHGKNVLEMRPDDAQKLANALIPITPLRRASRLKERALLDGVEWENMSGSGEPILSSSYAWLPPVLLAVAAFGGATASGSTTKAWNEAAERLRRARVVECERIALDLSDEGVAVASSEPAALWLGGEVLVVCRRVVSDYSLLAEALQASLVRLDLIRTLRLILRELNGKVLPSNEDIERALGFAEIDAQSLADIRHRWSGSVSVLVDRLRPVLAVLNITDDGLENAQTDETQLAAWLTPHVPQWEASDLLQAARRSRDDAAMGRRANEVLGEVAELPRWNAALALCGERYTKVRNEEAQNQAHAHRKDVLSELRAFIRGVAIAEGRPERFVELDKLLCNTTFPPTWAEMWWNVPFPTVCGAMADTLAAASVGEAACLPLRTATSADHLRELLQSSGVELSVRPYELAADNLQRLTSALTVVHDVYGAWLAARGTPTVTRMPDPEKDFPQSGYIDRWDDKFLLTRSLAVLGDAQFISECQECALAANLRDHLNLTPDDIEKRKQQRQNAEAEAARKKRTFHVAGGAFEVGKDDYAALLSRLTASVSLNGAPDVKMDAFTALAPPGPGHKPGGKRGGTGKSSHLRASPEVRELVGMVGEMLAYHFLRAVFGEDVVPREAWVSETRLKVLPLVPGETETCSDGYGWDFQFRARSKEWRVEVKASNADDEEFEMGVSELEAASRLAGNKTHLWRILRVRDALSASPKFDWLPNPFETEHREFYRLDQSSVRIKYVRKRS